MKFENTEAWGFEHAVRAMRNPLESWGRSDSHSCPNNDVFCWMCKYKVNKQCYNGYVLARNDIELMQKLIRAGAPHRKFMRQIFVSVDVTAPAYWWSELDTYKIGVTRNSCSFQHKGTSHPFTIQDFETDDPYGWQPRLDELNKLRDKYLETKDYEYFRMIRQALPMGYLYRATLTMSYENVLNMVRQRKNHKLNEWSGKDDSSKPNFIAWARTLPYAEELLFLDELKEGE